MLDSQLNKPSVKIILAYHKPDCLLQSSVYTPIHLGRKIANLESKDGVIDKDLLEKFQSQTFGDDTGGGISEFNRSLNEMTGVYWAWKNYNLLGNPEFIGLAHYRRQFIFDESLKLPLKRWLPKADVYCFSDLKSAHNYISTEKLYCLLEKYDCFSTKKYNPNNLNDGHVYLSAKDRFYAIANFDPSIYDTMEDLVLSNHPEYKEEIEQLRKQPAHYLFNMFVFKREIFFEYCDFIFPILFELDRVNKFTTLSTRRAPGFLAEFLTSMFISHQERLGKIKLKELNTTFIEYTKTYELQSIKITALMLSRYLLNMLMCFLTLGKCNTLAKLKYKHQIMVSSKRQNPNNVTKPAQIFIKLLNSLARICIALGRYLTI